MHLIPVWDSFDRGSRPQAGIGRDRGLSLIAIIFELFDSSFYFSF